MKHKRQIAAALFAAGLLCQTVGALPAETFAAAVQEQSGNRWGKEFTWEFDESSGKLMIYGLGEWPEKEEYEAYAHLPWCEINEQIQSVEIEYGITNIGERAFDCCYNLTEIDIPESVTAIGPQSFMYCTSLTGIYLPENLTIIDSDAFMECKKLEQINIPEGVNQIGDGAFSGCLSLTSFVIPEGITSVEAAIFSGCEGLTSVTIPDSVTHIGASAFRGCSSLKEIDIPDDVTSIGFEAFDGCKSLTAIDLPSGLTELPNYLFYDCSSLISVEIPDGVTDVGECVFSGCTALTSVEIPPSLTYIGKWMFSGCSKLLESFVIPDHITKLEEYAFAGCGETLVSIIIPETVTEIGKFAFYGCPYLKYMYIPASIKMIERGTFTECESLISVVILNPDCDIFFDDDQFYDDFLTFPPQAHIYGLPGSKAEKYAKAHDFDFFRYLRGDANCDGIVDYADYELLCALKNPDELSEAGRINADINYDYSIDSEDSACMQYYMENGCFEGETPPETTTAATVTTTKATTTVTTTTTKATTTATTTTEAVYEDPYSGYCGVELTWSLNPETGKLEFAGAGDMESAPWLRYSDEIKEVEFCYNLFSICEGAFKNCTGLKQLLITGGIETIGDTAFCGCTGLTAFAVEPDNQDFCAQDGVLYSADMTMLEHYPAAKSGNCDIPETVTSIEPYAFEGFHGYDMLALPAYVNQIGKGAFLSDKALTDVWVLDPDCEFRGEVFADHICLHGFTNSTLETYAEKHGLEFKAIDLRGDVNCNGEVDLLDVEDLIDYLEDRRELITQGQFNADINGDDVIDEVDLEWLKYYIENGYFPDEAPETTTAATTTTTAATTTTTVITTTTTAKTTTKITTTTTQTTTKITTKPATTTTTAATTTTLPLTTAPQLTTTNTVTTVLTTTTAAETTVIDSISGQCGSDLYWSMDTDNGVLFVDGSGKMDDYSSDEDQPWYCWQGMIQMVIISGEAESVGAHAFEGCTEMEELSLPDSLVTVGNYAFSSCSSLQRAFIPRFVDSIGSYAFGNCKELEHIVFLGTKCKIADSKNTISDTASIYGFAGSTAQAYAKKYVRDFNQLRLGDGTDDEKISAKDARLAMLIYTAALSGIDYQFDSLNEKQYVETILDVDGNGVVTIEDAQYILKYYLTGLTGYPQNWNEILNS